MEYLIIGFIMSIGWHLGKALLEEVYIRIYKWRNNKQQTLPDTVNYKNYS